VPPDLVATLKLLLPTASPARVRAATAALENPGPDCRMDFDAVLDYFRLDWPVWGYLVALLLYAAAVHGATYLALLLLARKERR
jgi:hypothetical protein